MNRKIREYQLEKGIIEPNSENEEDAKPNPKRKRHVIETVESPNRRKRAKQSNHRSPLPAESKPALQIVAPVRPSSEVRGVENDDHPAGSEDYGREIFATQESDSVEDVVGDDIHETADMGVGSDGEVWDRYVSEDHRIMPISCLGQRPTSQTGSCPTEIESQTRTSQEGYRRRPIYELPGQRTFPVHGTNPAPSTRIPRHRIPNHYHYRQVKRVAPSAQEGQHTEEPNPTSAPSASSHNAIRSG